MIAPSCSNCIYWRCANYSHYQGYCTLWADHPYEYMNGLHPFRGAGDCCSEHEPIENNRVADGFFEATPTEDCPVCGFSVWRNRKNAKVYLKAYRRRDQGEER